MRIIMWDDSSGDWALKNPRTIARRIVRGAHAGLDHRAARRPRRHTRPRTATVLVRALPLILDGLRAKHLNVVGLDQLIGGPTVPLHSCLSTGRAAQPM